jgi:UDPglucose--hexose-1-phosphate uridylyltransferase
VVVAAHRQDRPWSGELVVPDDRGKHRHDPECFLCPGVKRVSGAANPRYDGVFVFDNDRPCVSAGVSAPPSPPDGYRNRPASGVARVVCYTPRHDQSLGDLDEEQFDKVLQTWQEQTHELSRQPGIEHVLVFENRGAVVGASSPHAHCQIFATNFPFKTMLHEAQAAERHHLETGRVLFQDVIRTETQDGCRLLEENSSAVAFVPYFARWPYEVHVAPREQHESIVTLTPRERLEFGRAMKGVLRRYDGLWGMRFPYVMVLHQAPIDRRAHPSFHFHAEFHPPLRQPGLRKYLAGPEIGAGNFLNDTSPEASADALRAVAAPAGT